MSEKKKRILKWLLWFTVIFAWLFLKTAVLCLWAKDGSYSPLKELLEYANYAFNAVMLFTLLTSTFLDKHDSVGSGVLATGIAAVFLTFWTMAERALFEFTRYFGVFDSIDFKHYPQFFVDEFEKVFNNDTGVYLCTVGVVITACAIVFAFRKDKDIIFNRFLDNILVTDDEDDEEPSDSDGNADEKASEKDEGGAE